MRFQMICDIYKEDLAVNKLQWIICRKSQPNQIHPFLEFSAFGIRNMFFNKDTPREILTFLLPLRDTNNVLT